MDLLVLVALVALVDLFIVISRNGNEPYSSLFWPEQGRHNLFLGCGPYPPARIWFSNLGTSSVHGPLVLGSKNYSASTLYRTKPPVHQLSFLVVRKEN